VTLRSAATSFRLSISPAGKFPLTDFSRSAGWDLDRQGPAQVPPSAPNRVLIIDDDDAVRSTFQLILHGAGFQAWTAPTASQGLRRAQDCKPDLVLLDLRLPDATGLDCLAALKKAFPTVRVLMVTGFGNVPDTVAALKLGAANVIEKPVFEEDLLQAVAAAIQVPSSSSGIPALGANPALDPRVRRILTAIESSMREPEKLRVSLLAQTVDLHPSYLARLFRKDTGQSLSTHIRRCRVRRALRELRQSGRHLKEIARLVGYRTDSDLCRDFKRVLGCSPRRYTKRRHRPVSH
jgi:two-component system, response regulator YesN